MTLSFWKVRFSAQEVLDLIVESELEGEDLTGFEARFAALAEKRSRESNKVMEE